MRALRVRPFPPAPWRFGQDVLRKLGRLDHETSVAPLLAARREVLGSAAPAAPRFLVRVDEFPHFRAWDEPRRFGTGGFARFHSIMRSAAVPYLLAVPARVSSSPLDPRAKDARPLDDGELAQLARLREEAVLFALHGRDHRTRFRSPRRHSELCGLNGRDTSILLDTAIAELESSSGIRADMFIAPFNRFDARQWPLLAERFALVGGGPESIRLLGLQRAPQWRGESVYLPAYWPLYGRAADVLPAAQRAIEQSSGLWTAIVLHWGWEAEAGWRDLERLVEAIGPHAADWRDFRAAMERAR